MQYCVYKCVWCDLTSTPLHLHLPHTFSTRPLLGGVERVCWRILRREDAREDGEREEKSGEGMERYNDVFRLRACLKLFPLLPHACQPQVRVAAIATLNAWHDQIGLVLLVEAEIISTALATENPNLRSEVLYYTHVCMHCINVSAVI